MTKLKFSWATAPRRRTVQILLILTPLLAAFSAHAQVTEVLPGKTVTLQQFGATGDYANCDTQNAPFQYTIDGAPQNISIPDVRCDTNTRASGNIRVRAGENASFFAVFGPDIGVGTGNTDPNLFGSAVGTIGKTIRIPALADGQLGSNALAVQVATEVSWAGVLWNRRFNIPSWVQVVATLQIRDMTDATADDPGPVVASNTFLNERSDLPGNVPSDLSTTAVNAVYGWTSVRNASHVDLTAQLRRGRDYRIEVEARCDDLSTMILLDFAVGTGFVNGGGCFFSDVSDDLLVLVGTLDNNGPATLSFDAGDGFQVSPLTVTMQDDIQSKLGKDGDGDGVPNFRDVCPSSDLSMTVVIDGCDSGVENKLQADGCTISDRIGKCAADAGNHGQFVSCVAQVTNDAQSLAREGRNNWSGKGPIQACAAQASIP